ncbi:hypothetical protein C5167_007878, partial [Papaver somniferum]
SLNIISYIYIYIYIYIYKKKKEGISSLKPSHFRFVKSIRGLGFERKLVSLDSRGRRRRRKCLEQFLVLLLLEKDTLHHQLHLIDIAGETEGTEAVLRIIDGAQKRLFFLIMHEDLCYLCLSKCFLERLSSVRRRSRSLSPRRRRSRSPTPRCRKSRSPTPRRLKRQKSRSASVSPIKKSRSPSIGEVERKKAIERLKNDEEEKKRRQREAELKLLEEETVRRVEEAIRKHVEESLNSEKIKLEIQRRIDEGRKKLIEEVAVQLEKEKEAALIGARQKEEQARRERE